MIKAGSFFLGLFFWTSAAFTQSLKVFNLRCNDADNPSGIETQAPYLSWQILCNRNNTLQTAYRILVTDDQVKLKHNVGNIWDSKKVLLGTSIQVKFNGLKLKAATTYYWKVMIWDNHLQTSAWSAEGKWQMGLLSKADWKDAHWIAYDKLPDTSIITPLIHLRGPKKLGTANDVLPLFRKTFISKPQVKKATLYICGLGHFEATINGKKISDHFLDPGWTMYSKQALYVPFDVTKKLTSGQNTIGVTLGNGFYYIPRDKRYRKLTGAFGYPKMICRLVMEMADGSVENLVSDESWKTASGPTIYTSIYGGEDYNANLEQQGWETNSFNDSKWRKVMLVEGPPLLNAQTVDPLKVMKVFEPQTKNWSSSSTCVYDMGQNFSGIPEITVKGRKGDSVKITPAELINDDGTVNQKGSGSPHYYVYILKGDGEETWHPQFTYYGFRYIQIEGAASDNLNKDAGLPVVVKLKGLHTRNSAATVGNFSCSNELFNKTFKLIDWAIKSNMASVFTDCPHREKLGWLEEAHLVGNSIHYNYDIHRLALKCIDDMRFAQTKEGMIPEIAPEFTEFGEPFRDSPEWGSNAIILPWYTYQWYNDKEALSKNYQMMIRYLAYLKTKAKDDILIQGLGDWYDQGPKAPGFSQQTPKGITATAFYYYDLNIVAKIAALLGKVQDATEFTSTAAKVKLSFNKNYYNAVNKQYGTGSQAANAIAVYMGLVPPEDKQAVINNIINDLKQRNNALTAGDIGFRYLIQVLDEAGRSDMIYAMNSKSDVPGYGYQLAHGATALTESWGALPSVSNNHLMLGHIMEWFYGGLAGIRPATGAIGFNKIDIRPEVVGDVNWAEANFQSPYGNIRSKWTKEGKAFNLTISIPANTTATVYLPAAKDGKIYANGQPFKSGADIKLLGYTDNKIKISVGSGDYILTSK